MTLSYVLIPMLKKYSDYNMWFAIASRGPQLFAIASRGPQLRVLSINTLVSSCFTIFET